jgi:mono/diheme cytochrome c family protein
MAAHAWLFLAVGVTAALGAVVTPAVAADVKSGRALADKWCVSCHVIGPENQSVATDAAPTFVAIANRPSTSEEGLRAFLAEPHYSAMKGIVLPRLEIADLAAYIASLREQ